VLSGDLDGSGRKKLYGRLAIICTVSTVVPEKTCEIAVHSIMAGLLYVDDTLQGTAHVDLIQTSHIICRQRVPLLDDVTH